LDMGYRVDAWSDILNNPSFVNLLAGNAFLA